jgi:hypothetical protein
VGDVVVGVAFEIGLVCFVGLEVNLVALEHFERLFESARDLLVDEVEIVSSDVQLL